VTTQSWAMRAAVTLAAICLGLTGCSQPTDTSSRGVADGSPSSSASAATTKSPDLVCDGVETLFARMQTQASGWSPEKHPFDPIMASRVRKLGGQLAYGQRSATSEAVVTRIKATVEALYALAAAMEAKQEPGKVTKAVSRMRLVYDALRTTCNPGRDATPSGSPAPSIGSAPPANAAAPVTPVEPPQQAVKIPPQGPTCEAVQKAVVKMRPTWTAWSLTDRPFAPNIARSIRTHSRTLSTLASRSTSPPIRSAITASSRRFADLAAAMTTRRQRQVDGALLRAQTAYVDLQRVCSLS
jgi:hypothetical protein